MNPPFYSLVRYFTIFVISLISLIDIITAVFPDPKAPAPNIFYEFLHLLLILMVPTLFWSMASVHSLLVATQLLLIVQEDYQGIHLTILFWIVESSNLIVPVTFLLQTLIYLAGI